MELVRDVLHAKGYRTLEATTGEEAIELAAGAYARSDPLDIQLPGIDGVDRPRRLREDPGPPRQRSWR